VRRAITDSEGFALKGLTLKGTALGKGLKMQRDVKIGVAIGVLLIALIAIFWWAKHSTVTEPTETAKEGESALPPPVEPVAPTTTGTTATPGGPAMGPSAAGPATTPATGPQAMPPATGPTTVPAPTPATGTGPAPTPAPSAQRTHKVEAGESLWTIAKKYYNDGTKSNLILNANKDKITDPAKLKIGMELVIPDVGGTAPSTAGPATGPAPAVGGQTHTVAAGESLSTIAKKYYGSDAKSKVDLIYKANQSKIGPDPGKLKIGTVLVIPPESKP